MPRRLLARDDLKPSPALPGGSPVDLLVLGLHECPRVREPGTPKLLVGVRVLVVDGDADARDLLEAVFGYCGATVLQAASAREALAQVRATIPDVIVAGAELSGEDGYWFIRALRALDGSMGAVPAVLLAAGREHTQERSVAAGFDAHVARPADPWELCRVVAGLARKA